MTDGRPQPETIGERIRQARREAGLSARALAKAIGLSSGGLSHIETGRNDPSPATVNAIAGTLGVDPAWILRGITSAPLMVARASGSGWSVSTGEMLRQARGTRYSEDEFCRIIGCSRDLLLAWEGGDERPEPKLRARIERTLGIWLPKKWDRPFFAHMLCIGVPLRWPDGMIEFVRSELFAGLMIEPLELPLLASMAKHQEYWRPVNDDDWAELAAAMKHDFGGLELALDLLARSRDVESIQRYREMERERLVRRESRRSETGGSRSE